MHLLVVNPNSTRSMTDALRANVPEYFKEQGVTFTYFTGPASAPPQIDGPESSRESTDACLPPLTEHDAASGLPYFDTFDGVLIACFSNHPLVHELQSRSVAATPVLGIFHASIQYALSINRPFSIITSNKEWVTLLDSAVDSILGGGRPVIWKGTVSSNVQVLDLHDPKLFDAIVKRIRSENVQALRSEVIILGCAGFSGLEGKFQSRFKAEEGVFQFVDSVVIGLELLASTCRFNAEYKRRVEAAK